MDLSRLNDKIIACHRCPRLVGWREEVAREKRRAYKDYDYWGKPVPGFGDHNADVMIVGLAPGAHGSNRTGRQFTGDASGNFLFPALYRAGFANQPKSTDRMDGLILNQVYISAVCRCVPPGNKPKSEEISNCEEYLLQELEIIQPKVVVALGKVAFDRIKRINLGHLGLRLADNQPASSIQFGHGQLFKFSTGKWLVSSYHPSQQNTLTGRLTKEMFDQVWNLVRKLIS